jgi:DNA-binding MarR family transcriptional regulator
MSESILKSVSSSKGRGRSNGAATLVDDARAVTRKGHLEIRVWLRLLGCSVKMESLLSQRLRKEFKTSLSRFDVLAQLERFPDGLSMSDLSRRLIVSNGAITGLVDKLMVGGLVMRQDDPRDRRSVIVRLTRKGRESFLRMARRHEEWVVSILGDLSVEAQSELLQNLTLLQRNLDMHGKGSPMRRQDGRGLS